MNANPETAWAEDRIGKLTRVLVPVCWGSITFFVLMAIAGILLIGKFCFPCCIGLPCWS